MVNNIANPQCIDIYYNDVGCNVTTAKNNVSVTFMNNGNYTVLLEYSNYTDDEVVENYFIQYKLNEITTNSTYVFNITRDYDEIFIIVRNDDFNFSEGHRVN